MSSAPTGPTAPTGFAEHVSALAAGNLLRVVNFHLTPSSAADALRAELSGYAERYDPVTEGELDAFFATGRWSGKRPGLIPAFYEGYRDGYEVVAPILDQVGLTGWFFVCTGWVDTAPPQQEAYAHAHHLALARTDAGRDRIALSWDEVAGLAARHVVTPHTASHAPAVNLTTAADRHREIVEPKQRIESVIGRPVPALAYLHGTHHGLVPAADRAVVAAGYHYVFSNTMVQQVSGG